MSPLFVHDCEVCHFLGDFQGKDLYFCPESKTLIARHSSDGSDYSSGISFVGRYAAITEAFNRAYRQGLIQLV